MRNQNFDILLGAQPECLSDKQTHQQALSKTPDGFRLLENAAQTLSQASAQEPAIASDPYIIAVPLTAAAPVLPGPATNAQQQAIVVAADNWLRMLLRPEARAVLGLPLAMLGPLWLAPSDHANALL
jgi:hypothetical protein